MQTHFDYIITGGGCAGLSLLMHMLQQDFFKEKQILVIDKDVKNSNDRTWCFWQTDTGLFESIVHKSWDQIDFYSDRFSARFDIAPYQYKMIRGIDFYQHILQYATGFKNVHFLQAGVTDIADNNVLAVVKTNTETYTADYVFNSILFNPKLLQAKGSLLQHFKGWIIETNEPVFDSRIATFMDFRINAANSFVYMLPVNERRALVEYTVFSPEILSKDTYDNGLRNYILEYLQIENYTVVEEEFGVIPMTTHNFSEGTERVVNIGTAGGQTKASSGYTFTFIQKKAAAIVHALMHEKVVMPAKTLMDKRFDLYDKTLLNILYSKKSDASDVFADLFKNNTPQQVFKFLDNETGFTEELKIMSSVSAKVFVPAAVKQLFG